MFALMLGPLHTPRAHKGEQGEHSGGLVPRQAVRNSRGLTVEGRLRPRQTRPDDCRGMANESGSDKNLCFFITRIGEEGSSEREQADGVMDAIVMPAAEKLGLECVRSNQLPTLAG